MSQFFYELYSVDKAYLFCDNMQREGPCTPFCIRDAKQARKLNKRMVAGPLQEESNTDRVDAR